MGGFRVRGFLVKGFTVRGFTSPYVGEKITMVVLVCEFAFDSNYKDSKSGDGVLV